MAVGSLVWRPILEVKEKNLIDGSYIEPINNDLLTLNMLVLPVKTPVKEFLSYLYLRVWTL